MVSTPKCSVWRWVVALSVPTEILLFTAGQPPNMRNVALNKPCISSPPYTEPWSYKRGGSCSAAINGIDDPVFNLDRKPPNCYHSSNFDHKPFWMVDLGPNIYIHKINITGRSRFAYRSSLTMVYLDEVLIYQFSRHYKNVVTLVDLSPPTKGRVLKLNRTFISSGDNAPFLNVCEVKVFACDKDRWGARCEERCSQNCSKKEDVYCDFTSGICLDCNPGKWGEDCGNDCGVGCDSETCNRDNGTCNCQPGWKSPQCESCVPGKWGVNCTLPCAAGCDDSGCNKDNGTCICRPGWTSPICESCLPGKWGEDCGNDCGDGCDSETCNKDNGSCNCQPGWKSPQCESLVCQSESECECTTKGKYVFVDIPRKVNVAIGKTSSASTIMESSNQACIANDGYAASTSKPSCMSTASGDLSPFWQVDLEQQYVLAGISIDWDDKMSQRSGIDVLLDDRQIYSTNNETADPSYIPTRNLTGRVVKLQRRNGSDDPLLMICEVEVYNCRPGFYGHECEGICEHPICENSQICSRIDGSCPETVTEPAECSIMIIVEGCLFAFIVIALFVVAAKTLPIADITADEEDSECSDVDEEAEHEEAILTAGIKKASSDVTAKGKMSTNNESQV